jgi:hypothetical protein
VQPGINVLRLVLKENCDTDEETLPLWVILFGLRIDWHGNCATE